MSKTKKAKKKAKKAKDDYLQICSVCGQPDVQIQAWVNINTNEIVDDVPDSPTWCGNCDADTVVIYKKDYKPEEDED